jgi:rSAM/selenodomain-associated transferase 2
LRALLRPWWGKLLGLTTDAWPLLSIVIPTLNAGAHLHRCLEAIQDAGELVVVDGGSDDDTCDIARHYGATLVTAPRGRGSQLRVGAEQAKGDWLLFLHADTQLGPGWREAVRRHMADHPQCAACFAFRLDDPRWQARMLERGVALRVRALALPYGDQGLLISRAHYQEVGGFLALPLMEDVDLVRRIGRGRLRTLDVPAFTSAERWRRDGWWHRSARNLSCLALYGLGVSPARIARLYG